MNDENFATPPTDGDLTGLMHWADSMPPERRRQILSDQMAEGEINVVENNNTDDSSEDDSSYESYNDKTTVDSEIVKSFECGICLNILHKPVTLICQHSFCKECASAHKEKKCGVCRVPYVVPREYNRTLELAIKTAVPAEYAAREESIRVERLKESLRDRVTRELRDEVYNSVVNSALEDVRTDEITAVEVRPILLQQRRQREAMQRQAQQNDGTTQNIPPERQPRPGNMIPAPEITDGPRIVNITDQQHQMLQQHADNVEHYIMMHLDLLGFRGIYANHLNMLLFIRRNSYYLSWIFAINLLLAASPIVFTISPFLFFVLAALVNIPTLFWMNLHRYAALVIQQHLLRSLRDGQIPVGTLMHPNHPDHPGNPVEGARYPVLEGASRQFLHILVTAVRNAIARGN